VLRALLRKSKASNDEHFEGLHDDHWAKTRILKALGRLTPSQVQGLAREVHLDREEVAKLSRTAALAYITGVSKQVQDKVGEAVQVVDALTGSRKARAAFWGQLETPARRTRTLVQLGVEADDAQRLSRRRNHDDDALRSALSSAREELVQMNIYCLKALVMRNVTVDMLKDFAPVARQHRQALGVRSGSFMDAAISAALERGRSEQRFNRNSKAVADIIGALALGAVTGGATTAAGAAAAGAASGAGSSAVTGLPDVLVARGKDRRAQLGVSLGVTDRDRAAKLKRQAEGADERYAASVAVSAATGALASGSTSGVERVVGKPIAEKTIGGLLSISLGAAGKAMVERFMRR
jgi:hypothetical protein